MTWRPSCTCHTAVAIAIVGSERYGDILIAPLDPAGLPLRRKRTRRTRSRPRLGFRVSPITSVPPTAAATDRSRD